MAKPLELFCGTKSITKEFQKLGWDCTTVDFDSKFEPSVCADILTLDPNDFKDYDVIWASPPCQAFSVAQIGRNWNYDNTPKTDSAQLGLNLLSEALDFIRTINPKVWFIENPVGKMRKILTPLEMVWYVHDYNRFTTGYCQYGDTYIYNLIFNMKDKKCPKCGQTKDINEFYKNVTRKEGLTVYCKNCIKLDSADYHLKNKELCKARLQEWRENNKEYVRERDKQYRLDNPEIEFAKQKRYRETHKEKLKEKGSNYRKSHRDYFNNKHREYILQRQSVSDGTVTLEFEDALFNFQGGLCGYCKIDLTRVKKHLDHIIPISRGGLHTKNNVHWTCEKCNTSKGNKLESEWLKKERAKPTDIWTNHEFWSPKPLCKRGSSCHVAAPRGSQTGTQGMDKVAAGVIPEKLCREIAIYTNTAINGFVEDGFGSLWLTHCLECGTPNNVVRPGKVQCERC